VTFLQWVLGFGAALLIAAAAYRARSLSRGGQIAALCIGTLTFGGGGMLTALLMITFFISASALSRIGGSKKQAVAAAFSKGGQRDHGQVLANGLAAALLSVVYGLTGSPLWAAGAAGALAAANADTWATEIGVLARGKARLITCWKPVPAGTSGGISLQGTAASLTGALLVGLVTLPFLDSWTLVLAVTAGGFAGALADSLLGALVQAMYWCPVCKKETERSPLHTCGTATIFRRGWSWLDNDVVNLAATLVGALAAGGLYRLF